MIDLSGDPLATSDSVNMFLKLDPDPRKGEDVDDWSKLNDPAVCAKIAGMLAFVHAYDYPIPQPGMGPRHLLEGIGRRVELFAAARSIPLGWAYAFAGAMGDPRVACAVHKESVYPGRWDVKADPLKPNHIPSAGLPAMNVKYMAVLALAAERRDSTEAMRNALEDYDDLAAKRGPIGAAERLLQESGKNY